jgi:hypothetical protein
MQIVLFVRDCQACALVRLWLCFDCASDKPEIRVFSIPKTNIPRILVFGNLAQSKTHAGHSNHHSNPQLIVGLPLSVLHHGRLPPRPWREDSPTTFRIRNKKEREGKKKWPRCLSLSCVPLAPPRVTLRLWSQPYSSGI